MGFRGCNHFLFVMGLSRLEAASSTVSMVVIRRGHPGSRLRQTAPRGRRKRGLQLRGRHTAHSRFHSRSLALSGVFFFQCVRQWVLKNVAPAWLACPSRLGSVSSQHQGQESYLTLRLPTQAPGMMGSLTGSLQTINEASRAGLHHASDSPRMRNTAQTAVLGAS